MEDKKKEVEAMEEELDFDDLEKVAGGAGMRKVKKQETQDISQSTIDKMNQ